MTEEPVDLTAEEQSSGGLEAERQRRIAAIESMRESGVNPYPYRFDRTHQLGEIRASHGSLEPGTETTDVVTVAGRIMLKRDQGKLIFCTLRDRSDDIQLFVSKSVVGDDAFDAINTYNLGDWVGVTGTVMTTRKGELSVKVTSAQLLAKAVSRTSGTASRTSTRAIASDTQTSSSTKRHVAPSRFAMPPSRASAARSPVRASSKSRPRCCTWRPAAHTHDPSSPTTTHSTCSCTCASPSSCT
ncbi:MAG: lysyl-tRNA synthetase [Actinomycetota bacterium]